MRIVRHTRNKASGGIMKTETIPCICIIIEERTIDIAFEDCVGRCGPLSDGPIF